MRCRLALIGAASEINIGRIAPSPEPSLNINWIHLIRFSIGLAELLEKSAEIPPLLNFGQLVPSPH